jgi:hypothetical protein
MKWAIPQNFGLIKNFLLLLLRLLLLLLLLLRLRRQRRLVSQNSL